MTWSLKTAENKSINVYESTCSAMFFFVTKKNIASNNYLGLCRRRVCWEISMEHNVRIFLVKQMSVTSQAIKVNIKHECVALPKPSQAMLAPGRTPMSGRPDKHPLVSGRLCLHSVFPRAPASSVVRLHVDSPRSRSVRFSRACTPHAVSSCNMTVLVHEHVC
jgi:hypothetical protein